MYAAIWKQFGDAERVVRQLRSQLKEHGISQTKLARKAGVQAPHLTRWLQYPDTNKFRPSMETRLYLCEAMEILIQEKAGKHADIITEPAQQGVRPEIVPAP